MRFINPTEGDLITKTRNENRKAKSRSLDFARDDIPITLSVSLFVLSRVFVIRKNAGLSERY